MRAVACQVWIVILNWNGLDDTLECLDSLDLGESDQTFTTNILVIDNGSEIDPTHAIHAQHPAVEVLRLDENYGFARGCNIGIERALCEGAHYVMLLNNDTIVSKDFIKPMIDYMHAHSDVGLVSPAICYQDNPTVLWFGGSAVFLGLGYFAHRRHNRPLQALPTKPFPVAYATGCCVLLSRAACRQIGSFDERFFAYFEDADLSLRAHKFGLGVYCVPQSVIWHKESSTSNRGLREGVTSPFKHYLSIRNRIATIKRHANPLERLVYLTFVLPLTTCYYLAAFTWRKRWKKMVWYIRGILHGVTNRFDAPLW